MAATGKTGADAFARATKRQAIILAHYAPKLIGVVNSMHSLGLLTDAEQTALITAFTATPALLAAIAKVADYAGLW